MHPLTRLSSPQVHVILILQRHCNTQHEINSRVTKARFAERACKLQIHLAGFYFEKGMNVIKISLSIFQLIQVLILVFNYFAVACTTKCSESQTAVI